MNTIQGQFSQGHSKGHSSRAVRDQIVGKCIRGVIARPGRDGEPPMVMMLQFDDGSVLEFVSPRSDRVLRAAMDRTRRDAAALEPGPDQPALAAM